MLLVDDIQFISSKPQTQEGFFHTFNELHMAGKQIVVTGDEPAGKSLLQERSQSRRAGGLEVDLQPPEYEAREAIRQSKAADREAAVLDQSGQQALSLIHSVTCRRRGEGGAWGAAAGARAVSVGLLT